MVLWVCMKNALIVPVVFCINLLFWTFILGLFFVMDSSQVFSALLDGAYPLFFKALAFAIVRLLPFTIPLSMLFVFFYLMRHAAPWWLSVPVVLILSAASVFFLIPLSWSVTESLSAIEAEVSAELTLRSGRVMPAGFIRGAPDGTKAIWFFEKDDGTVVFPVVKVDPSRGEPLPALSVYATAVYDSSSNALLAGEEPVIAEAGGTDSLLRSGIEAIPFLESLRAGIEPLDTSWHDAYRRSMPTYYLLAGSFFLALLALWPVSSLTGWRLLNMMLSLVAFGGLYVAYPHIAYGEISRLAVKVPRFAGQPEYIVPAAYGAIALILAVAIGAPVGLRALRRHAEAANG